MTALAMAASHDSAKPLDSLAARWPEISALLDQALALPAAERDAWLAGLSGAQAELRDTLRLLLERARQVESGSFLGSLPRLPTALAADEPQPGMQVGPYRLLSELGRGGMGSVWLAERADGQLKRQVALKLPRLAWGGAMAERLARERDILATLSHRHIARLYDAGVDAQGRPWLAMERVEGVPIDVHCRTLVLPTAERLRLLLQVCEAVAHAHAHLVVHRDLKPSNVLVDAQNQVRLLDFGVAKLMEGDRTAETALTQVSGRALTLDYASPEQIRGEPLGTASDVYSLGVLAYELLAQARPYRLKRGSTAELEEAIAAAEPPRASDVADSPAAKRALRGDLDAILNKALKKDPAERYPTMTALADELLRHLQGHPVLARPESRWYLARKFVLRHRVPVAAMASIVVALSTGLGVALWQSREAQLQAQLAQQAADREAASARLYLETLSTVAAWDAGTFAKPGSVPAAVLGKLDELERMFRDSPEHRLGLLEAVGQQLPYLGDLQGALVVNDRLARALTEHQAAPARRLAARVQRARILANLGRWREAQETAQSVLADPGVSGASVPTRAAAHMLRAQSLASQGLRTEADPVIEAGLNLLRDHPDAGLEAELHSVRAAAYNGFDDLRALRAAQASYDRMLQDPRAGPDMLAASQLTLGTLQSVAGHLAEAEDSLRGALQRLSALYGAADADTVLAAARLGSVIASRGRYDDARQWLAGQRAALQQRASADVPGLLTALALRQVDVELLAGDARTARRLSDAVDERLLDDPGVKDRNIRIIHKARAWVWTGDAAQALALLKAELARLPPELARGPVGRRIRLALVEAHEALGEQAAALQTARALADELRGLGAVGTGLYVNAVEAAAQLEVQAGTPAAAQLERIAALRPAGGGSGGGGGLQYSSQAFRGESALRHAAVLLAAERRAEAVQMLASAEDALRGQHPDSPRLAWMRRLKALSGP